MLPSLILLFLLPSLSFSTSILQSIRPSTSDTNWNDDPEWFNEVPSSTSASPPSVPFSELQTDDASDWLVDDPEFFNDPLVVDDPSELPGESEVRSDGSLGRRSLRRPRIVVQGEVVWSPGSILRWAKEMVFDEDKMPDAPRENEFTFH